MWYRCVIERYQHDAYERVRACVERGGIERRSRAWVCARVVHVLRISRAERSGNERCHACTTAVTRDA